MAKQPHTMSLDDETYIQFKMQSDKIGKSLSQRVEDYMKKQLNKGDEIDG